MRLTLPSLLLASLLLGCADKEPAPPPPQKAPAASAASVDSLLGNAPPPRSVNTTAPSQASPGDEPRAKPVPKPTASEQEAEAKEYANWEQSTRKSDWEKMLQLYLSDHKGRFPDSIEELAKAFSRPLPPLPAGSFLYIDRTNKVVRLKRF